MKKKKTYVIAQGQTHIDAEGRVLGAGAELELTEEQAQALGGKVIAREALEASLSEETAGLLEAAEKKAKALEGELEKLKGANASLKAQLEGLQQEKAGLLEQLAKLRAGGAASDGKGKKE